MKNILLCLSAIVFCIQDTHCSQPIPSTIAPTEIAHRIPTIEVIQPVDSTSSGVLHISINNNTSVEDLWKIHLFTIAIEKKLCPSVLDYAGSSTDQNIAINILQAITTFRNTIDTNKNSYFKGCPFLYETLFPERNQSPIKNTNNNGSPQPSSPRGRRASGSGQSFFNTFSIDPSIQEPGKECVLKNEEQKKLFTNIIAYCILNLNPQLISELYEKAIQPFQLNATKLKGTNDIYKLLEKNHVELTANYKEKLSYINELQMTIDKLKSTIKKLESENDPIDQSSEDNKNEINILNTQITTLKKELEKVSQQNNVSKNEFNQLKIELNQSNAHVSRYRLISNISFSTTIILLIYALYKNNLFSGYYTNMAH